MKVPATDTRPRYRCAALYALCFLGGPLCVGCGAEDSVDQSCVVSTDCLPDQICSVGVCIDMTGDRPSPTPAGFDAGPRLDRVDGSIASCPDAVACGDLNAECGVIEDGCGGFVNCGQCASPDTCGGGGAPNRCGTGGSTCTPATCQNLGAQCGFVDDGCNSMLDCGSCETGLTCGGGGAPNRCGAAPCVPATCQSLGAQCGDLGDGCSGSLSCGGCPSNHYCNGNRCVCTPKSCGDLNAECGRPDDGCGNSLNCGSCDAPEYCGGGDGSEYQCGCTNETQPPTAFKVFRTARNVNASDGSVDWRQLGDAQQLNTQGANFSVRGVCGRESDCGCCARAESVTESSHYLVLTNAAAGVPADAIVRGIEVEFLVKRNGGGTVVLQEIALVGPGVFPASSSPRTLDLSSGYRRFTSGTSRAKWGRSAWTPAEINATNFGVRLQFTVTAPCNRNQNSCVPVAPYVDGAQVRVFYDTCE